MSVWFKSLLFLTASLAMAESPNSLQTGLVGPGYVWSVVEDQQSESAIKVEKTYGNTTWENIPVERLDAKTYQTEISTATAFKPSKDFVAMISAQIQNRSHLQSMRLENSSYSSRANQYELMFRSVLDRTKWVGGISAGILTLGQEIKNLSYSGSRRTVKIDSCTLPILELTGGVRYFNFETLAKLKLYSSEISQATTTDAQGISRAFDLQRASPAVFNIATAWNGIEKVMLVLEGNYTALGQIANQQYEYSSVFSNDLRHVSGGAIRSKGKWSLSTGGKFFPSADFSIKGGLTFESSSATESQYHSHELDNFPGWSLSGGSEFITHSNLRAGLNFGYKIPQKVYNKTRAVDPLLEMDIPRPPNLGQNIYSARWNASVSSTWAF